MAIYLMNENGDWWEYQPNQKLFVLNSENIPEEYLEELAIPESWGFEPDEGMFEQFGTPITIDLPKEGN